MKFASKNIDHTRGLHAIAAFEAFKGLVVMAAGLGLFQFMNGNLQGLADTGLSILSHLHLNPAHHYPQIFLTSLENVTDQNIFWIAMGALAYSVVRLVDLMDFGKIGFGQSGSPLFLPDFIYPWKSMNCLKLFRT